MIFQDNDFKPLLSETPLKIFKCTQFVLKRHKRSPEIELLLDFRAFLCCIFVLVQSRCSCLEQPSCSSLRHVTPQTLRVYEGIFVDKIVVLLKKA